MFKLIAFISIFFVHEISAQNSDNLSPSSLSRIGEVLPPSPNASSLGKYGGVPINFSSGRANVNIPLYEVKTPNLQVPIGLSYSTSGFSVNEIASRVGLSWNINLGGVITRTVSDAPDELSQHLPIPNNFGSGDNETIYNHLQATEQSTYDIADYQHDIFTYNFGNYQGKFIIDGSNVVLLENINLKIRTSLLEINYIDGCTFQIITPDGITYCFGGPEATEYSGSESFGLNCGGEKDFNMNQTAWYLKKITHPGGDIITFTYSDVNFTYKSNIHQTETRSIRNTEMYCGSTGPAISNINSTCVTELISHGVRLDRISTSNGQTIDIEYQSREDLPGDYLINSIIIYRYNSTFLIYKKFHLEYEQSISTDYINTWNNEDALKKHVFLHSITEKDGLSNEGKGQYLFQYNSITELPPRLSFSQDYWGFFNGKSNPSLVYLTPEAQAINNSTTLFGVFDAGANRNSDAIFAEKGLLKKIIYPTGGADEITYESHQHRFSEAQTDAQNHTVNVSGLNDNDAVPKIVETTFTPGESQTVPLMISCNYIGTDSYDPPADRVDFSVLNVTDNVYLIFETTLEAGNNSPNEANASINLTGGKTYKIILKIWGQDVFALGNLTYQHQNITYTLINKEEGGVRIKEIRSINNNASENIKRYIYSPIEDFTISSCDVIGYSFQNLNHSVVSSGCSSDCSVTEIQNYTISSSSYNNIALFGGTPISYRSVIEANGINFENGATEYKFSMEADEAPEKLYGVSPQSTPFTNSGFNNGLLIYKRVLQKTATGWLTKTEDIYSYKEDNRINDNYYDYTIRQNYFLPCYLPGMLKSVAYHGLTPFDVDRYLVRKRWIYPETITTKQYSEDGVLSVNTQTIEEHSNTYNIRPSKITASTSSSNRFISKIITYSQDIFKSLQPQWLTNLKNAGYVEAPIEELAIKKIDNVDYVTDGQLFIYDDFTTKPSQIYKLKLNTPILLTEFNRCSVNNGLFSFDSRYENEINVSYNSIYGNTKSITTNNKVKVYLWDYNDSYPIAEANNATFDQIAYTSFESDSKGNWSYTGTTSADPASATGIRYYDIANGNITRSGLQTGTTYIITYWKKDGTGTPTVNSVSGTTLRTKNGWTLYQHSVISASTITVSGSGYIDELRLYPSNATMTTYTYLPLIGITSQCDANNRITYYEYDDFNRLSLIRDQDNNILKKICYNYAGQVEDCAPVTYYNVTKAQQFTRNNCLAGAVGSVVTYTVAANTYSSFINQADADQKAQNDVNANGQNFANTNGTCTFSSIAKSGVFTRNNCAVGGTGSSVTYTVAAGAYTSTISQADADQKAQNDVNTNGQNFANTNGTCTFSSAAKSGVFTRNNCAAGGIGSNVTYTVAAGAYTSTISQADADQKAQNDVNTNGQNFANTNGTCTFSSAAKSGIFTRDNCPAGQTGSAVTYTVAAGTYTSTISQANADQLAQNDVNANGQTFANQNGTCTATCNNTNCNNLGQAYNCINGVCEQGVFVATECILLGEFNWTITYHYEWSDNSWSPNYVINNQPASSCDEETGE